MPRLIIASNNAHKVTELASILSAHHIDLTLVTLNQLQDVPEIIEDGTTFEENATKKVKTIQKIAPNDFILADDSGLSIEALNGAPGVYSARYAGDHDDEANIQKVLTQLADVPTEQRQARFSSVIVLIGPHRSNLVVRGDIEGRITTEKHGDNGFGYDPIFYVPQFNKTFAELTAAEKNEVSHRGLALQKLAEALPEWL
ncbi:XTP/dITP diphosphatase [Leuconostoc fallax]|uniref:dITP/XTP pyrophosphatase n=1 Tax=Leuconostoc fallax TaxID=1251 RepID=A0A4R5N754_9LACO|nr:XTP/dITP diphosphatase [Leuconostoc fallax]MBU7456337.1 XTP/dITP diphosphatase [Leuconostoc fallax]TDG67209.1 hypothetical protein C5L23_000163 [Leuconostoc fallax]